ncbi:ciliary microtubule associated protein 1A-like [Tubulanus polymorphus]|uniref:ciliary microtubule associated protein 1A-like n=1 Tax=Tubulanus polymorphus TaxID=672921 RepID=UPI003DA4140D
MVYNYTIRRAPIAAEYSSPGPCYKVPEMLGNKSHDPRSGYFIAPAYSFGIKHGKFLDDCSPGPCYLPDSLVNRHGRDGTPKYSLYGRPRDCLAFQTPGPGAYSPEKAGPSAYRNHPIHSFGCRHKSRKADQSPAPNNYSLPQMVGKTPQSMKKSAPCYSLTGRQTTGSFHEDLQKTPGPGTYNTVDPNLYKVKQPLHSMTSRHVMPGDSTMKPGPGAHSPEKVWSHKTMEPSYSFGIRHSQYLAPLIIACQE